MPRRIREGDDEYIVYSDDERRLAMRVAVIAIWLFVTWLPIWLLLRALVDSFLLGAIAVILGFAAFSFFCVAVIGVTAWTTMGLDARGHPNCTAE